MVQARGSTKPTPIPPPKGKEGVPCSCNRHQAGDLHGVARATQAFQLGVELGWQRGLAHERLHAEGVGVDHHGFCGVAAAVLEQHPVRGAAGAATALDGRHGRGGVDASAGLESRGLERLGDGAHAALDHHPRAV